MPEMTFQRVCAASGIVCVVLFFTAFFVAGFIPPLGPHESAQQIANFYRTHATRVRLGAVVMLLSSMFYIAYTAVMSGQMRRTTRCHPTATMLQLAAGAVATVTFMFPAMLFIVASFRPGRGPETTQLVNDMAWVIVVIPWAPFLAQNYAFAYAILTDQRRPAILPRWLGYLNIWCPLIYSPAILLPFFKTGPFDWRGIFVFWIPGVVFTIQFLCNSLCLLRAIDSEQHELADPVHTRATPPNTMSAGVAA
jgi:hypothetical protein